MPRCAFGRLAVHCQQQPADRARVWQAVLQHAVAQMPKARRERQDARQHARKRRPKRRKAVARWIDVHIHNVHRFGARDDAVLLVEVDHRKVACRQGRLAVRGEVASLPGKHAEQLHHIVFVQVWPAVHICREALRGEACRAEAGQGGRLEQAAGGSHGASRSPHGLININQENRVLPAYIASDTMQRRGEADDGTIPAEHGADRLLPDQRLPPTRRCVVTGGGGGTRRAHRRDERGARGPAAAPGPARALPAGVPADRQCVASASRASASSP